MHSRGVKYTKKWEGQAKWCVAYYNVQIQNLSPQEEKEQGGKGQH